MKQKQKRKKKKIKSIYKYASQVIAQREHDSQREVIDKKENMNEKLLHEDFDTELSSNEPVRELFSGKNVRFKTQVTEEQRNALSILYHAYEQCQQRGIQFNGLKSLLDDFVDFGVSLDRKSRTEYVDAHRSQLANQNAENAAKKTNDMENMKV